MFRSSSRRASSHRAALSILFRSARVTSALCAGLIASAGLSSCQKDAPETVATPPSAGEKSVPKNAPAVPEPVRKVLGKWMRSDGGYVLEIKGADLSGVLDAAYFNPKSIHISRAIWMQGPAGALEGESAAIRVYENYGANWNFGIKGTF